MSANSDAHDSYLALDVGGSGSRLGWGRGATFPVAEATGPSVAVGRAGIDVEVLMTRLGETAEALRRRLDLPRPAAIALGMSGFVELVASPGRVVEALRRTWPEAHVLVGSDSVTSLVGALGLEGGAVVAAGTGTVGLGSDLRSVFRQVDGWGHLLGDTGGGAWIGMHGLQAAMRALDGREGGSAALLAHARTAFGRPQDVVGVIYTRDDRARLLASFAPAVAAAARDGDTVAAGVWQRAGTELARTVTAALAPGLPRRVALVGGLVAAGPLLTDPFHAEIARTLPGAEVRTAGARSLPGAAVLARAMATEPSTAPHHPPYVVRDLVTAAPLPQHQH